MSRTPPSPLADALRGHVVELAGAIGERNVWRRHALHVAADYIRREWQQQGHAVVSQHYLAYRHSSAHWRHRLSA